MIRPMFDEQYPDGEAYDTAFDSTEVMLGIVAKTYPSPNPEAR